MTEVGLAQDRDGLRVVEAEALAQRGDERTVDPVAGLASVPLGNRVDHLACYCEVGRGHHHATSARKWERRLLRSATQRLAIFFAGTAPFSRR